jgi:Bacterial alpha-L-rhamnosidase C-terminal domain
MFSGGIGTWLYEFVAGINFEYIPMHTFQEDDHLNAEANALLATSTLNFDPRIRSSLTSSATIAALNAASLLKQSRGRNYVLDQLFNSIVDSGVPIKTAPPKMQGILSALPDYNIIQSLRSASGWRMTSHGNSSVSWSLEETTFTMNVTVPSGVIGRIGIPLSLMKAIFVSDKCPRLTLKEISGRKNKILYAAKATDIHSSTIHDSINCNNYDTFGIALCKEGKLMDLQSKSIQPQLASIKELRKPGSLHSGIPTWSTGVLMFDRNFGSYQVILETNSC